MSLERIHAIGSPSSTPNAAFGWLRQSPAQSTTNTTTPSNQVNMASVP
jgi:hypothetical protein